MYILIFLNLSKKSFQQQILIPLDPGFDDNSNDNDNDNDQDGNQPIVETKETHSSDGSSIKITRIHYHKRKNLNGDSEAITPFQMLKIFDDRINSIFEEFAKESMGFSNFFHRINMDYDDDFSNTGRKKKIKKVDDIDELFNEIDKIEKDFSLNDEDDDDEDDDNFEFKIIKNKNENIQEKNDDENEYDPKINDVNQDQRQKKIKERKNKKKNRGNKKNEATNENNETKKSNDPNNSNIKKEEKSNENIKNKKVKGNKLTRKQLIFSRICKYIFYTMILFVFYFIIKKILEFLEIIDPEGASEYKILEEEAVHLKKEENKQY